MKPAISRGDRTLLAIATLKFLYPILPVVFLRGFYFDTVRSGMSRFAIHSQLAAFFLAWILFGAGAALLIKGAFAGRRGEQMRGRHVTSRVLDGLAFLVLFLVYLATSLPGWYGGDSGVYLVLLICLALVPQFFLALFNYIKLDSERPEP